VTTKLVFVLIVLLLRIGGFVKGKGHEMNEHIFHIDEPTPEDQSAILSPLVVYNKLAAGSSNARPVVLALKDDGGAIIGGLWGKTAFDWLFVEFLVVPEAMRGRDLGTSLMFRAEEVAVERKCVGAWLDTFAFQARGFYEKIGYSVFGEIADHPRGSSRYFLQKRFG
jgi:GNAT superfamily N-acetyltransferase